MAWFVNPYNFIPLGEGNKNKESRKSREASYRDKESLKSGWLDVVMNVKTPLIVPDGAHPEYHDTETGNKLEKPTEEQKKKAHKKYSFYHVEGENGEIKYVVPGSELRGMIRSVYEAITDSCFPFLLNDDKPVGQRVPCFSAFRRRGLLKYDKENDQWSLWETRAEERKCNVKRNKIVYKGVEYKCGKYIEGRGYVQCNIPVSPGNYHIAFLNAEKETALFTWEKGEKEPYDMLKYALDREGVKGNQRNPNKSQGASLKKWLEEVKENGGMVPVWFMSVSREGKDFIYYLSNSSIGRVKQRRKWEDIFVHHRPCDDTGHLCPACTLFGTIKGKGMKGRVRFSDAECKDGELTRKTYLLDILGEPRTSAFEFYLRKPAEDAGYWNFDFYGRKIPGRNRNDENDKYCNLAEATPRGRKMYWHGKPSKGSSRTELNATMEGVESGTFRFKVYFDQITETQLQDLIWVLSLGENENTKDVHMLHKLGHARPLGYGSVKLCVEKYNIRKISKENGNILVDIESNDKMDKNPKCNFDKNSPIYKSLIKMCDARSIGEKEVRYPRIIQEEDDSIYHWFANNRRNMHSVKTLPEPTDQYITLWGSWLQDNTDIQGENIPKDIGTCKGRIKMMDERGFGFISYDKGDIFFHCSDLRGNLTMESLHVDDRVCFEIEEGKKGPAAMNISREQ
ncbi:cold shock domain-containing protein [Lachnospiraceae bacterium 46-15]